MATRRENKVSMSDSLATNRSTTLVDVSLNDGYSVGIVRSMRIVRKMRGQVGGALN